MPARSAAWMASSRESTPSLANTAAKWWSTVRTERDSRAAISALRRPSHSNRRTSSSRDVRPNTCSPRRSPRSAGHAAHASVTQAPAQGVCCGPGTQCVEDRQRLALGGIVAVGQCACLFVRAAQMRPKLPRLHSSARRSVARRARRSLREPACRTPAAPAPVREFADEPRVSVPLCQRQSRIGFAFGGLKVTALERCLGARCAHWRHAL